MGPAILYSICQSTRRQMVAVTRCQRRRLSFLAQQVQVEPTPRTRPEPVQIPHEQPPLRQRPDPHVLVSSELLYIRKGMLNLLGSAHPSLADIAGYYLLHPSKQLRSLLVLLFSRATNGLGRHWDKKHWDAVCERNMARSDELDRPLTLSDVLNEWNPSMPDDSTSFESVFMLQQPVLRPPYPPQPPRSPLAQNMTSRIVSPPSLLPTQIRLAQIVEMIHVASLLHDTISETPEGAKSSQLSSAQSQGFGNKLSILGGDFLLGRASTALSRLGEAEVVELIASVISNQVEGEFVRTGDIKTPELGILPGPASVSDAWGLYQRKTYLKTASLMAKGARSAVILGGCQEGEPWKEAAYEYGRNLGFAYQLVEDALEMKQMQPGLATAPALFASEECTDLLPLIHRNFSKPGDTSLAVELIQNTSGLKHTWHLAQAYADNARNVLQSLPDSDTKLALEALTEIVIQRTW